ncbi:hypothetical protein ES703_20159 [subsurface metagenome]
MKIKGEQPKTMIIRLPENIVAELKKMKLDQDLPTVGSALKFWIEQQQNEKIETRLNSIEEEMKTINKIFNILVPNVSEMRKLFNRILNVLSKMDKRTEERFKSLEANQVEKVK